MPGKFVDPHATSPRGPRLGPAPLALATRPPPARRQLTVIDVTLAPGKGHDFHKHPDQEEVILDRRRRGRAVGRPARSASSAPATRAFVPAGVVHASFNAGSGEASIAAILGPCVGEVGYVSVEMGDEAPWNTPPLRGRDDAQQLSRNCTTPCGPASSARARRDSEPIIPLDTLLELTANAEVDGQKFDGVDLFVAAPHFDIDSDLDAVKRMTDHIAGYGLKVGSFVAPIWAGAGGGSAMGAADERKRFLDPGPQGLRDRPPDARARHPPDRRHPHRLLGLASRPGTRTRRATPKLIAETFREAGDIAADHGEFLVAEGEICWGGMHSWRDDARTCSKRSACPGVVGYQADMAHSMLYTLGYNAEKPTASCPKDFDWKDKAALDAAYQQGRRRAAPLDPRLPRRPERRHRLRLRRPREDRPPLPGRRPERPARYRQARRLLAARREGRAHQDACATSAGTAACSRTR